MCNKSNEIKERLHGKPYLWKDVWYCIFNNGVTLPESISFLCRIKVMNEDAGVIYSTCPDAGTYWEHYFDDIRLLNSTYKISKRKILNDSRTSIGFEGRILNDARYS